MRFFILLILISCTITSCSIEADQTIVNTPAATRLDSLKGDWYNGTVVMGRINPAGSPMSIFNADSCHLYADLTGKNTIPVLLPTYNFTYRLLSNDTLIFNTNPGGTPSYDTNYISFLDAHNLWMTCKRKQVTVPLYTGTYYISSWHLTK